MNAVALPTPVNDAGEPESDAETKAKIVLPEGFKDDDEFCSFVRKRYERAAEADRENLDAAIEDMEFLVGEQWDKDVEQQRQRDGRPTLIINRLIQQVAQVAGDTRMNKPAIRVRPVKDATKKVADTREGLVRAIERDSVAGRTYTAAGMTQAACGIGQFRVELDYADADAFDQDIRIAPIPNPFAVVWDELHRDPTGRDARFVFVHEPMDKDEFEKAYPDKKASDDHSRCGTVWYSSEHVTVCEYWSMKETPVRIGLLGDGRTVDLSTVKGPVQVVRARDTVRKSAVRYLLSGMDVLEGPYELPISRVPIIRVPGWEIPVGERRVRFGLIRWAKDPQRFYNVWRSAGAEAMGQSTKGKWVAAAKAVEGYENDWRDAHVSTDPLLRWTGNGTPPVWVAAPPPPAGLLNEASMAAQDIKDVTGLHDASLGARSNETSGKAILARQREGDVATFVYQDNLNDAVRECGTIVNELIPIAYDTPRTLLTLGEDGSENEQRVNDPIHPQSIDLALGKYSVTIDTGPSFTTRRVEASESMQAFIQAFPAAAPLLGDLFAQMQDWPLADEVAERLRSMLPPQLQKGEDGQPMPQPAPPPPPPPDPAQMAAMQAQQRAAEVELRTKTALAVKAEADAHTAESRAKEAELELEAKRTDLDALVRNAVGAHLAAAAVHQPTPQPHPMMRPETIDFGRGPPTPASPQPGLGQPAP